MSLIDPINPAFWADGEKRSEHTGFTLGFGEPLDWAKLTAYAAASAKCTNNVERRRENGTDNSTFRGLSKKSDAMSRPFGGAYSRAVPRRPQGDSKAARIRELLKAGPKDSVELAKTLGIKGAHARALMQYDVERGRLVKLHAFRPVRYALPEAA